LEEAGKFAAQELAPLNRTGDIEGCRLENGIVRTPPGFKEAYGQLAEAGWLGMVSSPDDGGQGLPHTLTFAAIEMWSSANLAFSLVPLLAYSAIELIEHHATPEQKSLYLGNMISGAWSSTMNLTEPQAGSDLGRLRTRATPEGDHYRIAGQKIFITGGDHDLTENIIHLVLARTPDAPPGSRGISLFLVPKILVAPDGTPGARNDLKCVSLEHKLGIHGSPTCVMSFGDDDGAIGYLIGEENKGLACMFAMMNMSRLTVGIQGVGIGERAYQQALAYARERVQGSKKTADGLKETAIIEHADVRRMLASMKSLTEAHRALALYTAGCMDLSKRHPDLSARENYLRRLELLTPIVKAWITDGAIEVANTGIQVHGGTGYIEETGAAQHLRDARITAIYEGTNGIQAGDLVGRKVLGDDGQAVSELLALIRASSSAPEFKEAQALARVREYLLAGLGAAEQATKWILEQGPGDLVAAIAHPYLTLLGNVIGGWLLAQSAARAGAGLAANDGDTAFLEGKLLSARQFAEERLSGCLALGAWIEGGGEAAANAQSEHFGQI